MQRVGDELLNGVAIDAFPLRFQHLRDRFQLARWIHRHGADRVFQPEPAVEDRSAFPVGAMSDFIPRRFSNVSGIAANTLAGAPGWLLTLQFGDNRRQPGRLVPIGGLAVVPRLGQCAGEISGSLRFHPKASRHRQADPTVDRAIGMAPRDDAVVLRPIAAVRKKHFALTIDRIGRDERNVRQLAGVKLKRRRRLLFAAVVTLLRQRAGHRFDRPRDRLRHFQSQRALDDRSNFVSQLFEFHD